MMFRVVVQVEYLKATLSFIAVLKYSSVACSTRQYDIPSLVYGHRNVPHAEERGEPQREEDVHTCMVDVISRGHAGG